MYVYQAWKFMQGSAAFGHANATLEVRRRRGGGESARVVSDHVRFVRHVEGACAGEHFITPQKKHFLQSGVAPPGC